MKDFLSSDELTALSARFITVRRKRFIITVWERKGTAFESIETFPCAIGAKGFETPYGPKIVSAKTNKPDWLVPNSPWAIAAGLPVGRTIPFDDPSNPIKAAFLRLTDDGVGIHGTENLDSLGHPASHGCIRVTPDVAKWLYDNIPVGTPVMVI
jgi:L,D-transpeptidase ErfK/SrfK